MLRNLPNILTASRILLLPVLVALFFMPGEWTAWTALGIYIICCLTDFLDGYVARSMQTTSKLGTFLDPISDKIFIATLLIVLVGFDRLPDLWMIPTIVIMARELLISGLREFLGPQNIQVPVSKLAKWKTTVQMVALGFLIIGDYGDRLIPNTLFIGQCGIAVAAVITIITGWNYLKAGFQHIK
jgi:cardiolipin synthase